MSAKIGGLVAGRDYHCGWCAGHGTVFCDGCVEGDEPGGAPCPECEATGRVVCPECKGGSEPLPDVWW